ADLLRRVAGEGRVEPIARALPYYPATDLFGSCAPSFTLPDLRTGDTVTFAPGRPAGGAAAPAEPAKPTLLVFWSATGKHCQREVPEILRHARQHPGEYDVVSVTRLRADAPGRPSHRRLTEVYVRANGIDWPVLEDVDGSVSDLYQVVSTPTTFLVAPNGE